MPLASDSCRHLSSFQALSLAQALDGLKHRRHAGSNTHQHTICVETGNQPLKNVLLSLQDLAYFAQFCIQAD